MVKKVNKPKPKPVVQPAHTNNNFTVFEPEKKVEIPIPEEIQEVKVTGVVSLG